MHERYVHSLPKTIEKRDADEKRIADCLNQAEIYWDETAPYGAPGFDVGRGLELLLYETRRYSEALRRIAAKAEEQEALMKHREQSGEAASEADRQRWFAYLDVAHIAEEALSHRPSSIPQAEQTRIDT